MTRLRIAAARGSAARRRTRRVVSRRIRTPVDTIDAVAIVPAGGVGSRMGRRTPKQYLTVGGAPLIVHTARALVGSVRGVVVVAPADRVEATRRLLARHRVPRVLAVVAGGAERQESVWLGLLTVPSRVRWVIVHDAVRPFVTPDLIERVLAAAAAHGAATCGVPVRDTVKRVKEEVVQSTIDRDGLWLT